MIAARQIARPAGSPAHVVEWDRLSTLLVVGLVVTAGLELLLLRLLTRSVVHIPGLGTVDGPFAVLAETGRLAFQVASLLLILLLVVLAARFVSRSHWPQAAASAGLILFAAVAAAAFADVISGLQLGALSLAAIALIVPAALSAVGWRGAASTLAFTAAFLLTAGFALAPQAGWRPPAETLVAGEALALGFAITSPLLVRPTRDRFTIAAAALTAVIVLALLLGNAATTKNLALWSVGLAGYFPSVAYAAAAGALAYAIVGGLRGRSSLIALGVSLIALGGIGFHSTYQTGLVVLGLAVIGASALPSIDLPRQSDRTSRIT